MPAPPLDPLAATLAPRWHRLPRPPATQQYVAEECVLVRERRFLPGVPLMDILRLLVSEKATGKLIINLSQGSVGATAFEDERKKVNGGANRS